MSRFPYRVHAVVREADRPFAETVLQWQIGAEAEGAFSVPLKDAQGNKWCGMSSASTEIDAQAVHWYQTSPDNPRPKIPSLSYVGVLNPSNTVAFNSPDAAGTNGTFTGLLSRLGLTIDAT